MTPKEFRDKTIGHSYDFDNYPPGNKYQCIDYFNKGIIDLHIPVNIYCALSGYVRDLWYLRDQYGYYNYFDYVTDPNQLINGDWCIWDFDSSHPKSHVAMYYNGLELGQNQPRAYVNEKKTTFDILGAFRPKNWTQPRRGYADGFSADFAHTYGCGYPLHLRTGGAVTYPSICVMNKGDKVTCYGYYHKEDNGRIWLYCTYKNIVGFACMDYMYKVY